MPEKNALPVYPQEVPLMTRRLQEHQTCNKGVDCLAELQRYKKELENRKNDGGSDIIFYGFRQPQYL